MIKYFNPKIWRESWSSLFCPLRVENLTTWSPKFVTLRILPDPFMALQILQFLPNHLLFDFRSSTYYWFMYLLMVPYSPYGIRTDNYVISALNDQNWMILNWIIFDQFSRNRHHVNLKSRPIDSSGLFLFGFLAVGSYLVMAIIQVDLRISRRVPGYKFQSNPLYFTLSSLKLASSMLHLKITWSLTNWLEIILI